jgi:dTDP-4-dehydrorhamnose 3,5-epimerase
MRFLETGIVGAWLIDPCPRRDDRGHIMRAWCSSEFLEHGICFIPVQANVVSSRLKGTIRGMHYWGSTTAEAKLIRCTRGAIFDVAIDLRPGSPTYGEWYGVVLTADNGRMMFVPGGCPHGCETLEKNTEMHLMASEYEAPEAPHGVRFDDPAFDIQWPVAVAMVSKQDRSWPLMPAEIVRKTETVTLADR